MIVDRSYCRIEIKYLISFLRNKLVYLDSIILLVEWLTELFIDHAHRFFEVIIYI